MEVKSKGFIDNPVEEIVYKSTKHGTSMFGSVTHKCSKDFTRKCSLERSPGWDIIIHRYVAATTWTSQCKPHDRKSVYSHWMNNGLQTSILRKLIRLWFEFDVDDFARQHFSLSLKFMWDDKPGFWRSSSYAGFAFLFSVRNHLLWLFMRLRTGTVPFRTKDDESYLQRYWKHTILAPTRNQYSEWGQELDQRCNTSQHKKDRWSVVSVKFGVKSKIPT